jgi:hypothetical protein
MWTYKGIDVYPADRNSAGLRWAARTPDSWPAAPPMLRANTKQGMRELITHYRNEARQ